MVFSQEKYAELRKHFFAHALIAVGANSAIVFTVGWLFGGVPAGVFLLSLYFFLFGLIPILAHMSSITRFHSPPIQFFPETKYPFLSSEWNRRLRSHGFTGGNIAYFCDITYEHKEKSFRVCVVYKIFHKEPTLIVSESILASVEGRHLVAYLEHEIGHLRSGLVLVRHLTHSLASVGNVLLFGCAYSRLLFGYLRCMHIACRLYVVEKYLACISSRPTEQLDEHICDALAVQALGEPFAMQEALAWLALIEEMDVSWHEHNEHLSTHPTIEKRIALMQELYT